MATELVASIDETQGGAVRLQRADGWDDAS
jgi:hypothetical protein